MGLWSHDLMALKKFDFYYCNNRTVSRKFRYIVAAFISDPINWTDSRSIPLCQWCCYDCQAVIVCQYAFPVSCWFAVVSWENSESEIDSAHWRHTMRASMNSRGEQWRSGPDGQQVVGLHQYRARNRDIERVAPEIRATIASRHCSYDRRATGLSPPPAPAGTVAHNKATVIAISALCWILSSSQWTRTWCNCLTESVSTSLFARQHHSPSVYTTLLKRVAHLWLFFTI